MFLGLVGCIPSRAPVEPATDVQSPRTIDAGGQLGLKRLDDLNQPRYPVAFSRDGRRIAALLYEQQRNSVWTGPSGRVVVKAWDVATGRLVGSCRVKGDALPYDTSQIAGFADDDTVIVVASAARGRALQIYRAHLSDGRCEQLGNVVPPGSAKSFIATGARLTPDASTVLVAGATDKGILEEFGAGLLLRSTVRVALLRWTIRGGESRWIDLGPDKGIALGWRYAFSGDATRIAAGGPQWIRVWNTGDGQPLPTIKAPAYLQETDGYLWPRVAVSADGRVLARYSPTEDIPAPFSDKRQFHLRVWNVADASVLKTIPRVSWQPDCLAFSPDGRRLAGVRNGGGISVWEVQNGQLLSTTSPARPRKSPAVGDIHYSPDGDTIATFGERHIELWAAPR